ncbi:MAG: 3-isopropylmalate dehydratase small subunit [Holophaga sp.]|nr:3-isopropylmalate dehydratase small subunit [Holophaga sp.]
MTMPTILQGCAHVYSRAHINTDEIIPARYLNVHEEAELAKHAMEDIDPDFLNKIQPGDFIVAGEDFGCGSSREHAIWALRGAGIKAVIASSYARIFFRNALNNGYLAIECPEAVAHIKNGARLELDLEGGVIHAPDSGETFTFVPLTDFAKTFLEAGGLLPYLVSRLKGGAA